MFKKVIQYLLFIVILLTQILPAQSAMDEMYRKGPQKNWDQEQIQDWWRWFKTKFNKSNAISLPASA